jgi:glucose/mannose-6-phosphate isomerase
MFDMVKRFPTQLEEAMKIGSNAKLTPLDFVPKKLTPLDFVPKLVFVAGMGGSGIGADFVASFIAAHAKIPYLVGKSYEAPAFIDKESLVIASSYSGNTEETLSAIDQILPYRSTNNLCCFRWQIDCYGKRKGFRLYSGA